MGEEDNDNKGYELICCSYSSITYIFCADCKAYLGTKECTDTLLAGDQTHGACLSCAIKMMIVDIDTLSKQYIEQYIQAVFEIYHVSREEFIKTVVKVEHDLLVK